MSSFRMQPISVETDVRGEGGDEVIMLEKEKVAKRWGQVLRCCSSSKMRGGGRQLGKQA